jgi:hypothetical protein
MKKVIVLLFLLLQLKSFSQILYSFESGTTAGWSFSQQERWAADSFQPINGSWSLHHVYNNSSAATDAASFSLEGLCPECADATWSFYVRHGYAPSASNKWAFVISSDINAGSLLSSTGFNGFVIGVNLMGNDDTLRLWSVTSKGSATIISSQVNWEKDIGTSAAVRIVVTRQKSGDWILSLFKTDGALIGTWKGHSSLLPGAVSSGIVYSYTATADQLLWLDDVSVTGKFVPDTTAPSIVSVKALSLTKLRIVFDEDLQDHILPAGKVTLTSGITILKTTRVTDGIYDIELTAMLKNKKNDTAIITDLCDKAGNCSPVVSFDFTPAFAETGDVVISEIMFDPSPPVDLPDDEYVEIYNRTDYDYLTSGWMLIAGSDTSFLPDRTIARGEFLILCSTSDTSALNRYGRTAGIKSFPGLNDTGELIALKDGDGALLHGLEFGPELYNDDLRSGGGWSVELTDLNAPFNTGEAWCASQNPLGGTPGKINSVQESHIDTRCPELLTVYPADEENVVLVFNETMTGTNSPAGFICGNSKASEVTSFDLLDRFFLISFDEPFRTNQVYTLEIPSSLTDFAGNALCKSTVRFGIPVGANTGEILFNELLFNPVYPCEDFIELYNNSSSVFDLSDYYFTSTDPDTGKESALSVACSFNKILLPGDLTALTVARNAILEYYPCAVAENVIETDNLPSMPDDKGIVSLYSKALRKIDRVAYNSSMHLIFLSGDEGVSLEKVNPSLPSGVASNWHSASESCSWATPGAANSVLDSLTGKTGGVTLSGERVSPDGDGFEDVVSVNVYPGGSENVISIKVYDNSGNLVRVLCDRFYAGEGASFVWDGTSDNRERVKRGLYLILVMSWNADGEVRRWKKVCAVLYN